MLGVLAQVNDDVEAIIAPNNRMGAEERSLALHHILIEHNELCIRIADYNKFWAKYLSYSYFLIIALICYSTFQVRLCLSFALQNVCTFLFLLHFIKMRLF